MHDKWYHDFHKSVADFENKSNFDPLARTLLVENNVIFSALEGGSVDHVIPRFLGISVLELKFSLRVDIYEHLKTSRAGGRKNSKMDLRFTKFQIFNTVCYFDCNMLEFSRNRVLKFREKLILFLDTNISS